MSTSFQVEQLAATIADEIYLEVSKWHLYLNDAHLHGVVAEQLLELIESGNLNQASLFQAMHGISVSIGGGKSTLPLTDFIPDRLFPRLLAVLEDYGENCST